MERAEGQARRPIVEAGGKTKHDKQMYCENGRNRKERKETNQEERERANRTETKQKK